MTLPPISFEIFPPKTPDGVGAVYGALEDLSRFNPDFVSVTYGAMGTTQSLTKELVLNIREKIGLETVPHFTCVGSTREEIREYLLSLKANGIDRVLALRGDPPAGESRFVPPTGGFAYANELVAYIKSLDNFRIAVAGYPEGHIEAPNKTIDLQNLKRKVDAGAEMVITQLFFDNRMFFDFIDRARQIGISVPIIPGIMPIVNYTQIARITSMCGASLPADLTRRLEACQDDPDAMVEVGIEWATEQVSELISQGCDGLHFYIMNRAYSTAKVLQSL